jgi:hypothetical protein
MRLFAPATTAFALPKSPFLPLAVPHSVTTMESLRYKHLYSKFRRQAVFSGSAVPCDRFSSAGVEGRDSRNNR